MAERNSPVDFIKAIFGARRFSKKKTKTLPKITKKVSIKHVKPNSQTKVNHNPRSKSIFPTSKTMKHDNVTPTKIYRNPLSRPVFPFSRPVRDHEKFKRAPTFNSSDLSLALSKASPSGKYYRGTSGNVKLVSDLGNLKPRSTKITPKVTPKVTSIHSETIVTSKIVAKTTNKELDPEKLKTEGNEKHKKGKFEEALALYNQAIFLDPNKASYYSNKSASLMGLGRLVEAVFACREAIQTEPSFERAHHRLATLYFRLGEAEKALYHYKESGPKAGQNDITKSQALKTHITKCKKAKELNKWDSLEKHSRDAISSGADSAPQVYAMLVEALLKLHRHQEAYNKYQKSSHFDTESCSRLFGPNYCAYLLTIQAQVYLAAGRFEDAKTTCHELPRYSTSDEVNALAKRVNIVLLSRSKGNKLFKVFRFSEASIAYSQGLDHDPYNSTLLCNRAACELKLEHIETAIEDCTKALNLRPNYSKARLRRAECYVRLEDWEAAMIDYEKLIKENPEDEKLNQAMLEAILQLRKQRGNLDTKDIENLPNLVSITSHDQFQHHIKSSSISVVIFSKKKSQKQISEVMQQLFKEFSSLSFIKVEVEDYPLLSKSEGVITSVPSFMIYKNGSKIQEIPGKDIKLLESSLRSYNC